MNSLGSCVTEFIYWQIMIDVNVLTFDLRVELLYENCTMILNVHIPAVTASLLYLLCCENS